MDFLQFFIILRKNQLRAISKSQKQLFPLENCNIDLIQINSKTRRTMKVKFEDSQRWMGLRLIIHKQFTIFPN